MIKQQPLSVVQQAAPGCSALKEADLMKWPPVVNNRHFELMCAWTSSEVAQYRLSSVSSKAALQMLPFQPALCASSRSIDCKCAAAKVACLLSTSLRVPVRPGNQAVKPGLSPPDVTSHIMFPWRGRNVDETLSHGAGTEHSLFHPLSLVRRRKHKLTTDAVCETFYATTPPNNAASRPEGREQAGGSLLGQRVQSGMQVRPSGVEYQRLKAQTNSVHSKKYDNQLDLYIDCTAWSICRNSHIIWRAGVHLGQLTMNTLLVGDCNIRRLCSLHKLSARKKTSAYFHSCDKDSEVNPVFWVESQMGHDVGGAATGRHLKVSRCPPSFMWRSSDGRLTRQETDCKYLCMKRKAAGRDSEIWGVSLTIHLRRGVMRCFRDL